MYKIVTLTGLDRIGKETQSYLLTEALKPAKRMTSPDYTHWSGQLIRAILQERLITLNTEGCDLHYKQDKNAIIFQLLQAINTTARQDTVREGLKSHHWVMDRYIEDAIPFGLEDGCPIDFLLALQRTYVPSDLVIVLLGKPFPRAGEIPDINERNSQFQQNVRDKYCATNTLWTKHHIIDVDLYRDANPVVSMAEVHENICRVVRDRLGLEVHPLDLTEIEATLRKVGKELPPPVPA